VDFKYSLSLIYRVGEMMNIMHPQLIKAQTTIEYLLIISVVVLLLISLFLTMKELRESTQGNVTVNNQSQSPTEAIKNLLNESRNLTNQNTSNQTP
jgi:uncharacterized protein (UPF0333 family)